MIPSPRWPSNSGSDFRIVQRDIAKRRHEQKNEERNNAIRKRAFQFKEKEKGDVTVIHASITRSIAMCICFIAYNQYVPTVAETPIWIRIIPLLTGRLLNHISLIYLISHSKVLSPSYSDTGITVYKVNIVQSRRIRLGECYPVTKRSKKKMNEPIRTR